MKSAQGYVPCGKRHGPTADGFDKEQRMTQLFIEFDEPEMVEPSLRPLEKVTYPPYPGTLILSSDDGADMPLKFKVTYTIERVGSRIRRNEVLLSGVINSTSDKVNGLFLRGRFSATYNLVSHWGRIEPTEPAKPLLESK